MSTTTATDPTVAAACVVQDACDAADIAKLRCVIEWAVAHEIDEDEGPWGDCPLHLAGEGAPMVAEYAAWELAAAMRMSSDAGAHYIGRALELRYRLPKLWKRVVAGEVPVWRAFRIAEATIVLPMAGARYVDVNLAPTAHRLSFAQQDRTVEEALVRYDPDTAEAKRLAALKGRRFDVWSRRVSFDGTIEVSGTLDVSDALDLDDALSAGAAALAQAGCSESLDVRRSMAAGVLARGDATLDLQTNLQTRPLVIHVHDDHVGLLDTTRSNVSVDQVAAWCGTATKVTIKPVIDLNQRLTPRWLRSRVSGVSKPLSRRLLPGPPGFETGARAPSSTNERRRHHRAKTYSGWAYVMVEPGTYHWTSPPGLTFDT